ncbi:hypothetical protein [Microvirga sesbaniae]|uniref:hypothetical protein n=1 Tax=Microvirga sesbaniae TaxID=681392 RepID=UPI0021C9FDCC|nr:hypothetical protein [Microvirga sp. HBU67692]
MKRAKFEAYALAARQGGFLYLDSDIIVLRSLEELIDFNYLVACRDDLSECPFISDKRFPWPNHPELEAGVYINSGVMFFPRSLLAILEEIYTASLDDDAWHRYIAPGHLYDNHFLCAYINLKCVPVRFENQYKFNWQGLRAGADILVSIKNDVIITAATGDPLHLMHFAGIEDIDSFLLRMKPDILEKVSDSTACKPVDILDLFQSPNQREICTKPDIIREVARLLISDKTTNPAVANTPTPYIPIAETFLSFALSENFSDVRWNGFPCGGAYLNSQEYHFLRSIIRTKKLNSVVEVGGGYTSILLNGAAQTVLSIEAYQGPWLDAAIAKGCDVEHIPFDATTKRFNQARLEKAIRDRNLELPDLLFIDSPIGTANRDGVLRQIEDLVKPRYIAFHDARRDSTMIYEAMLRLGYRLDAYLPTHRGFVVLAAVTEGAELPVQPDTVGDDIAFTAEVVEWRREQRDTVGVLHKVRLTNTGSRTLAMSGGDGLFLTYHVVDSKGDVLCWENPRTTLPCDLEPGDEIILDVIFGPCDATSPYFYFDMVCEHRYWVSNISPNMNRTPVPLKSSRHHADPVCEQKYLRKQKVLR